MEYVIQENTFREQNYNLLQETLDRFKFPYTIVRVFPFADKIVAIENIPDGNFAVDPLPEFEPKTKNVFVFGSLKLARLAAERGWTPGSLMNDNHDFKVYSKYYKENLLNYDSDILTVGNTNGLEWSKYPELFIRPTKDTKAFTGKVFTEKEWNDTKEHYLHNYRSNQFNEETEIQVSSPKQIFKEIRFWVVGGKIITGSQYRIGNQTLYDDQYEQEAVDFAQLMVDTFQLAPAFVIDVCLTENGWKIVECGCINCAGFYKCDMQKMIAQVDYHFGVRFEYAEDYKSVITEFSKFDDDLWENFAYDFLGHLTERFDNLKKNLYENGKLNVETSAAFWEVHGLLMKFNGMLLSTKHKNYERGIKK